MCVSPLLQAGDMTPLQRLYALRRRARQLNLGEDGEPTPQDFGSEGKDRYDETHWEAENDMR